MRRIVRPARRPRVRLAPRRSRRVPAQQQLNPVQEPATATAVPGAKTRESATSVSLIGPQSWRTPLTEWIEYQSDLVLSAELDPENRPKHVFDVPASEVVIALGDAEDPDPVVELALELQAKNRGTGIILVLSALREDTARRLSAYAGSWSMVTAKTTSDPLKLSVVIQSSARGMPVVEPAVTQMLEAGWQGQSGDGNDLESESASEPESTTAHEAA